MAAKETFQIVLAWTDMSGMEATGKQIKKDLNWFPEYKPCIKPYAAMWLGKGTTQDVEKAQRHLDSIKDDYLSARVFVYPRSERNPLERARKEILSNS